MNRGEKEGFLKVSVETDSEKPLNSIFRAMITDKNQLCSDIIREACTDTSTPFAFVRFLILLRISALSDTSSAMISIDAQEKLTDEINLALDPGYRTGCASLTDNVRTKLIFVCNHCSEN